MDHGMKYIKFWFVNCAFICALGNTAAYAILPGPASLKPILDPALSIEQQDTKTIDDQTIITNVVINNGNQNITQIFLTQPNTIITANNTPVEVLNNQVAINDQNLDVTRILKSLGVPLEPITAMHVIDSSPNRDHIRSKLISLKLIDKDQEVPLWTVNTYSYWRQNFTAHSNTTITQTNKHKIYDKQKVNDKQKTSDKQDQKAETKSLLSMPWNAVKKIYNATLFWRSTDSNTVVSVDQST